MPVFNQRVHFFREAVESVLRQTYTDLHLIIHHMENYAKDHRVTLVKNETNQGIAVSLNLGI